VRRLGHGRFWGGGASVSTIQEHLCQKKRKRKRKKALHARLLEKERGKDIKLGAELLTH
jgi:hypothetical protein